MFTCYRGAKYWVSKCNVNFLFSDKIVYTWMIICIFPLTFSSYVSVVNFCNYTLNIYNIVGIAISLPITMFFSLPNIMYFSLPTIMFFSFPKIACTSLSPLPCYSLPKLLYSSNSMTILFTGPRSSRKGRFSIARTSKLLLFCPSFNSVPLSL